MSCTVGEQRVGPIQHSVVDGEGRVDRQIVISNAKCLINDVEVRSDMTAIENSKSALVDRVNCCHRGVGSSVSVSSQPVGSSILIRVARDIHLLQSNYERCTTIGCGISPWCRLNSYGRLNDCGRRARRVSCATSTDMSCQSNSLSVTCL